MGLRKHGLDCLTCSTSGAGLGADPEGEGLSSAFDRVGKCEGHRVTVRSVGSAAGGRGDLKAMATAVASGRVKKSGGGKGQRCNFVRIQQGKRGKHSFQ